MSEQLGALRVKLSSANAELTRRQRASVASFVGATLHFLAGMAWPTRWGSASLFVAALLGYLVAMLAAKRRNDAKHTVTRLKLEIGRHG